MIVHVIIRMQRVWGGGGTRAGNTYHATDERTGIVQADDDLSAPDS